jgi:DNA-binding transcriptional LysR family regulator
MGPTMGEYLLPQVCSALIAAAPDITIGIFIGMDAVLRSNLRAGSLDILVSPVLAGEEREFMIDVFNQDAVVVVAAHGHPLCGRPVTIHDLAPYRWVLPDRSVGMRQWLDRMFEANGILGPSVQIETNSIVMLPRLIVETELLSFTSTRNLSPSRIGQYVEPLKLDITTMRRHFGIVQRRDIFPSPAVSRVAALLLEKGRLLEREA